jgi:hypothetical protein
MSFKAAGGGCGLGFLLNLLTAVENDSAGRSKTIALGSFDLP